VNLMRVSAFCNGREETDLLDASLMVNCIWSTERQEGEVMKMFATLFEDKSDEFREECEKFKEEVKEAFYTKEVKNEETRDGIGYYECECEGDGSKHYISKERHSERYNEYYMIDGKISRAIMYYENENKYKDGGNTYVIQTHKERDDEMPYSEVKPLYEAFLKKYNNLTGMYKSLADRLNKEIEYWRKSESIFANGMMRQKRYEVVKYALDGVQSAFSDETMKERLSDCVYMVYRTQTKDIVSQVLVEKDPIDFNLKITEELLNCIKPCIYDTSESYCGRKLKRYECFRDDGRELSLLVYDSYGPKPYKQDGQEVNASQYSYDEEELCFRYRYRDTNSYNYQTMLLHIKHRLNEEECRKALQKVVDRRTHLKSLSAFLLKIQNDVKNVGSLVSSDKTLLDQYIEGCKFREQKYSGGIEEFEKIELNPILARKKLVEKKEELEEKKEELEEDND
jgi:hypothetical protein